MFGQEPTWLRRKRLVDPQFDERYNVDTGGITHVKGSHSRSDGVDHIAIDPVEFGGAIAAVCINHAEYTFLDLGCGKGRALLLASNCGFAQLIGVEYDAALVATARNNMRSFRRAGSEFGIRGVEIVHCDAGEYELPDTPIFMFLYNPFGPQTMARVAVRARESLEANPRPFLLAYLNAFQAKCWTDQGFRVVLRGDHFCVFELPSQDATSK